MAVTDEEEIRHVIEQWHEATAKGKLDEILSLMADDVVFLTPGNPPMRGKEAFAAGFRSVIEKGRIESRGEPEEISVAGDLAYSWTQLSVRMISDSGELLRTGPTLTIFRKDPDGRWVVYRDANMLTTADEH
jgi:uncharacterized protein (TIGR02246 family)